MRKHFLKSELPSTTYSNLKEELYENGENEEYSFECPLCLEKFKTDESGESHLKIFHRLSDENIANLAMEFEKSAK